MTAIITKPGLWHQINQLLVDGAPKPEPRMRACVREVHKGRGKVEHHAQMYKPPSADDWKARIIQEAQKQLPTTPHEGPVRIDVKWFFPRPKHMMTRNYPDGPVLHWVKPDRDNLDKCILDALAQIRFIKDDAQVCVGLVEKWYHAKHARPGAVIRIFLPAPELTLAQPEQDAFL